MKFDIIPEKKRKLVFSIYGLVSLLVAVFTGVIDGTQFIEAFKVLIMTFIAGNGVEHLAKSGGGILGTIVGNFGGGKKK